MADKLINAAKAGNLMHIKELKFSKGSNFYSKFFSNSVNINSVDSDGKSALWWASSENHLEVVKYLLKCTANVNLAEKTGQTPLLISSLEGHYRVVEELLQSGADPNINEHEMGTTPLMIAAQKNHLRVCELLLENSLTEIDKSTSDGLTPLFLASQIGHSAVVELLLLKNANTDVAYRDGSTPLYMASSLGYAHIVVHLLNHNAKVDKAHRDGRTPLWMASQEGHAHIVVHLLKHNADTELPRRADKITPLQIAVQNGHIDVVKLLLEANAAVNTRAINLGTPAHLCALFGHVEVMELLIQYGADVYLKNALNATPLAIAIQGKHDAVVQLLYHHKSSQLNQLKPTLKFSQTSTGKTSTTRSTEVASAENQSNTPTVSDAIRHKDSSVRPKDPDSKNKNSGKKEGSIINMGDTEDLLAKIIDNLSKRDNMLDTTDSSMDSVNDLSNRHLQELSVKLALVWYELGVRLECNIKDLSSLEDRYGLQSDRAAFRMLIEWKERCGGDLQQKKQILRKAVREVLSMKDQPDNVSNLLL